MDTVRDWLAHLSATIPTTIWDSLGDFIDGSLSLLQQSTTQFQIGNIKRLRSYTHQLHSSLVYLLPTEITQLSWRIQELLARNQPLGSDIWELYQSKVHSFLLALKTEWLLTASTKN